MSCVTYNAYQVKNQSSIQSCTTPPCHYYSIFNIFITYIKRKNQTETQNLVQEETKKTDINKGYCYLGKMLIIIMSMHTNNPNYI